LKAIVAERASWADQLAQVKRMHQWVMEVEHLLDESLAQPGEMVSNATVGSRLDAWRARMAPQLTDGTLSELEVVGARCCPAAATDRTGLPTRLCSLARSASRSHRCPA